MTEKISCFEMKSSRDLNTVTSYLNISKIRVLIQIKLCRNPRIQMDLSKNNCFSADEVKNYILRTEKRKKVPVYEMLEFSCSLSSPIIPILSWKLKIHTEVALRFLHHQSWSSIVTKSSIKDDLGIRDPPVCLFSVQNITKKIKI